MILKLKKKIRKFINELIVEEIINVNFYEETLPNGKIYISL